MVIVSPSHPVIRGVVQGHDGDGWIVILRHLGDKPPRYSKTQTLSGIGLSCFTVRDI